MVFWNRLRQSLLQNLSKNQFKKCNLQTHSSNQVLHSRIPRFASLPQNNHPNDVRFYAAPVQVKKKVEDDTSGPKLNEMITSPFVRLVLDEGHKVVSIREAIAMAKERELDLVQVDKMAKPPVCKLMDYKKERYNQQVKEKERSKAMKANLKKGSVKEIRFAGQINPKDLQLKADSARRLLEEGYRVKCLVKRKKPNDDLGNCLSRYLSLIQDVSIVEFGPIVEEDQAHFMLRHVKMGKTKSGKKASIVANPSSASAESESGVGSEQGSESDEEDLVFDAEDGASANVRPNKEELTTLPVNRYAQPTSRGPAAPVVTENRYKRDPRVEPPPVERGRQPQFNRVEPPPTERGRQPQFNRVEPPPTERGRQPQFNRTELPPTERGRQPQFNSTSPHNREGQRPGFGNPNFPRQNSPGSSRGNFGASNSPIAPEQQTPPGPTNRYKKVSPGDSRLDNRSSSSANSRQSRGPVIDKDKQDMFREFSSKK